MSIEQDIQKYHIDKENLLYIYDIGYANYKRDMRKLERTSMYTLEGFLKDDIRFTYINKLLRKYKVKKICLE